MAAKTKSKKTATPLKDIKELFKEAAVPGRFESPLTGEYVYSSYNNDGVTDAPYDKPKETTVDDIIRTEYSYCVNSLTGPQRALLSELIRIRRLMESK